MIFFHITIEENKMETKKPFPLEKILNISASEYCQMIGARLSDYFPIGVHYEKISYWGNPTEDFADFVPEKAEIIVNYQVRRSLGPYQPAQPGQNAQGVECTAHGTALIPKNSVEVK